MTGLVSQPFANVAVVEAVGLCHECRLVTRFMYRLHDDMRVSGLDKSGRWATWQMRKSQPGVLERLLLLLIKPLRFLIP